MQSIDDKLKPYGLLLNTIMRDINDGSTCEEHLIGRQPAVQRVLRNYITDVCTLTKQREMHERMPDLYEGLRNSIASGLYDSGLPEDNAAIALQRIGNKILRIGTHLRARWKDDELTAQMIDLHTEYVLQLIGAESEPDSSPYR